MKISTLIAFLILVILGCKSTNEFEKHEPNLEAVNLYKEAYRIALLEREHSEKVDSAMLLLEKAIQFDSMYIEPHFGIIGFATLNKDKTQAIEYCHRAQRIFVNFPEFILLEGAVRESNKEKRKAKELYKIALNINLYTQL